MRVRREWIVRMSNRVFNHLLRGPAILQANRKALRPERVLIRVGILMHRDARGYRMHRRVAQRVAPKRLRADGAEAKRPARI